MHVRGVEVAEIVVRGLVPPRVDVEELLRPIGSPVAGSYTVMGPADVHPAVDGELEQVPQLSQRHARQERAATGRDGGSGTHHPVRKDERLEHAVGVVCRGAGGGTMKPEASGSRTEGLPSSLVVAV